MDIFPILHFNYTPPAGVSAENKMSFSVLNASLSMGGYQSNTAGITNETKISAISINIKFQIYSTNSQDTTERFKLMRTDSHTIRLQFHFLALDPVSVLVSHHSCIGYA